MPLCDCVKKRVKRITHHGPWVNLVFEPQGEAIHLSQLNQIGCSRGTFNDARVCEFNWRVIDLVCPVRAPRASKLRSN
jgi:hypothetical protein